MYASIMITGISLEEELLLPGAVRLKLSAWVQVAFLDMLVRLELNKSSRMDEDCGSAGIDRYKDKRKGCLKTSSEENLPGRVIGKISRSFYVSI